MSKLSFRARALDPSKPMPIYLAEELPDLQEYSAINRAVPQMPSGMEKEEESVSTFFVIVILRNFPPFRSAIISSHTVCWPFFSAYVVTNIERSVLWLFWSMIRKYVFESRSFVRFCFGCLSILYFENFRKKR